MLNPMLSPFSNEREVAIKVVSVLSLWFFLKRFELPFNFFTKIENFLFIWRFETSIDDSPLPKPKFIDHITQNSNFDIVILRCFVLLEGNVGPFDNEVYNIGRSHLETVFRFSVDDCLLKSCSIGSPFAELLRRTESINLKFDFLWCSVLIIVFADNLFCFLKFMQLKFGLLVFALLLGNVGQKSAGLLHVHRKQSFIQIAFSCKFSTIMLKRLNFLSNWPIVVAVNQRTHLVNLPF